MTIISKNLIEEKLAELEELILYDKIKLPSPPEIYLRVTELLSDDRTTVDDLSNLLATDGSLLTRLFKISSSPIICAGKKPTTINEIVMKLGFNFVKNLVFCAAVKEQFKSDDAVLASKMLDVWSHTSKVSKNIVSAAKYFNLCKDIALVLALLHEIGKLPTLEYVRSKNLDYALVEHLYKFVTILIVERWNFPNIYIQNLKNLDNTEIVDGKIDYHHVLQLTRSYVEDTISQDSLNMFNITSSDLGDIFDQSMSIIL